MSISLATWLTVRFSSAAALRRRKKSTASFNVVPARSFPMASAYHRLRELIYQAIADAAPFAGEIEVDESYFGGRRKGKRGRGAAGKVPV
ncbi:MAG TPA: hypothetical protein VIK59_09205, partial [Verrucomicrobiae bacterium]